MTDNSRELMQRASQGDAVAVEELLVRHLPGLHAFIRLRTARVLRNQEASEDLVQSVCRELLEGLDQFQYRGEAQFKGWLYTAALRKLADRQEYYHAARRDVDRQVAAPVTNGGTPRNVDALLASFLTPSHDAAAKEELARVEAAFAELGDDDREVILLSRLVGLSHADIGRQLDIGEGAVATRLYRALARLSARLQPPS